MKNLDIRKASIKDVDPIVKFNQKMALETENKKLDQKILKQGVTAVFNDPNKGFYLIAEKKSTPVACLLITKEWSDWRNGYFWWIQSVYVIQNMRRKGIFTELHKKVKKLAINDKQVVGLRLYVEENNKIAQKTYRKIGMDLTYYKMFEELI